MVMRALLASTLVFFLSTRKRKMKRYNGKYKQTLPDYLWIVAVTRHLNFTVLAMKSVINWS